MKSDASSPPAVERPVNMIKVSPASTVPLAFSSITTRVFPPAAKLY